MYDIWNNQIESVEEVYQKDNYQIKINNACNNNVCYIFFSSNNIWYPNTEESFRKSFITNDYYEWTNYLELPAEKVIYVRDIYKSWYVTGINKELNSIDAVIDFLKEQTSGMKIITFGSSAGGYMASLTASLLNAMYCICFSAQFDLTVERILGVNPFLKKYSTNEKNRKYYDITDIIKNSSTHIFYFMPAYSESDKEQVEKVAGIENVNIIKIASKHHGVPIFKGNLPKLLQMNEDDLISLFNLHEGKIVRMICMSVELSGILGTGFCIITELIRLVRKYIGR